MSDLFHPPAPDAEMDGTLNTTPHDDGSVTSSFGGHNLRPLTRTRVMGSTRPRSALAGPGANTRRILGIMEPPPATPERDAFLQGPSPATGEAANTNDDTASYSTGYSDDAEDLPDDPPTPTHLPLEDPHTPDLTILQANPHAPEHQTHPQETGAAHVITPRTHSGLARAAAALAASDGFSPAHILSWQSNVGGEAGRLKTF